MSDQMLENHRLEPEEKSVLQTVCYSSLFDYPLTVAELSWSLICERLSEDRIREIVRRSPLDRVLSLQEDHIFLRGERHSIERRRQREAWSRRILRKNRWILRLITQIPFTRMVAISGSGAHLNMTRDGDIDLFVVTRHDRLWGVAVAILLLTRLTGTRSLICFNYLLADTTLDIQPTDLFVANQLLYLMPLSGRDIFFEIVRRNDFVQKWYPGRIPKGITSPELSFADSAWKSVLETVLRLGPAQFWEWLCRTAYRRYLTRRSQNWATPEDVLLERNRMKLHTESHRLRVMEAWQRKVNERVTRLAVSTEEDQ